MCPSSKPRGPTDPRWLPSVSQGLSQLLSYVLLRVETHWFTSLSRILGELGLRPLGKINGRMGCLRVLGKTLDATQVGGLSGMCLHLPFPCSYWLSHTFPLAHKHPSHSRGRLGSQGRQMCYHHDFSTVHTACMTPGCSLRNLSL